MRLRSYRSFSTELLKIAGDLQDADIRRLLAERRGDEYLPGGELPTETRDLPHAQKLANMALGTAMIDMTSKKKDEGGYGKVRDWGWRGVQGAAAGAGLTKLVKDMAGRPMGAKDYRRGALVGAGVSLADRAWRYRKEIGKDLADEAGAVKRDVSRVFRRKKDKEKTADVEATPGGPFRSPASALDEAQRTGSFKSKVVHNLGKPFKVPTIGKNFRLR